MKRLYEYRRDLRGNPEHAFYSAWLELEVDSGSEWWRVCILGYYRFLRRHGLSSYTARLAVLDRVRTPVVTGVRVQPKLLGEVSP